MIATDAIRMNLSLLFSMKVCAVLFQGAMAARTESIEGKLGV